MRWVEKPYECPEHGTERTVTKFLLFPMKIGKETRWLETVTYTEKYSRPLDKIYYQVTGKVRYLNIPGGLWWNRKWVDENL